ncbi:30S ribosomal protein S17 [Candidatus Termititenax persephonae]|uniref:Small ribosomal subunit protein uS17 n=1 Tax=Candidatus Termititenax persephonae TaxID=2218525 RepID=A0A388THM5_9BACT|nr:30S ribosomal protein S17 [Candidatus Termititenax persephonae]
MRGTKKVRRGIVVSSKMSKTIVVRVDTQKAHPQFGKIITVSNKFHAHDEQNTAQPGDEVLIMETRKLSRTKNWRLVEIVKKGAKSLETKVENSLDNIDKL